MNKPQPNISRLAMTGLPRGRGRKGGKPKRTRLRLTTNTDVFVSHAATIQIPSYFTSIRIGSSSVTVPAITTPQCSDMQSISVQVGDNCTNTQSLNVSAEPSSIVYSQSAAGNNVASPSPLRCQVPITNQQSILLHTQGAATINSGTSSCTMSHGMPAAPNTNPFYVCFIAGNIRVCQGCRSSLKGADGCIPAPPFDLCCAHAEKCS